MGEAGGKRGKRGEERGWKEGNVPCCVGGRRSTDEKA